jgi:hypothetical protein
MYASCLTQPGVGTPYRSQHWGVYINNRIQHAALPYCKLVLLQALQRMVSDLAAGEPADVDMLVDVLFTIMNLNTDPDILNLNLLPCC